MNIIYSDCHFLFVLFCDLVLLFSDNFKRVYDFLELGSHVKLIVRMRRDSANKTCRIFSTSFSLGLSSGAKVVC